MIIRDLTKEEIKAIRIVKGFNKDLRTVLKHANKDSLYYFIEENRTGIFGVDMAVVPDPKTEDFDLYERQIRHAVSQVINGK